MLGQSLFAQPDSLDADLLSLDSLLNMRISSVSKYEQTTAEAPASVTIISHEDIRSYGYNDLSELLTTVRDLYFSNDRNYGFLGVRGFSRPSDFNNRVAFMVNGVLLNENVWGQGAVGSEFDGFNMDDVERVEIIRGPASAVYGNYPMLGLINVITHTGKTQDGVVLSLEQGSFGKWQANTAVGKKWESGLHAHVGARLGKHDGQVLYFPEYDDSTTNYGIADHMDYSKFLGVNGQLGWKFLTLKALYTWREVGVPTGAYETVFGDRRFRTRDAYGHLELGGQQEIRSDLAWQGRLWLSHFHYDAYYPFDSANGGLQNEQTHSNWLGIEGRLRWDITENNRLLVGMEMQQHIMARYFLDYPDRVVFDENFPFGTFGVYVQDEYQPLKKLAITGGIRYDRLYLGRNAVTPRLALNYFVGKRTTLKAIYGQAFRAPTIYEVNVGFDGYILPNFNLRAEQIKNLELVCEQRVTERLHAVASVYTNRLQNIIEQAAVQDTLLQFQNVQRAGGYGGSVELTGRLAQGLNFYMSYGYATMRNLEDNLWLTNSPHHLAKAGVSIPFFKHFRISPELYGQTERLTVYNTLTDPFVIANATLLVSPQLTGKAAFLSRFSLMFKVRNLLDTEYAYPGGFEHRQAAIIQNGRNYSLKLQVTL